MMDESFIKFCVTERQKQVLESYLRQGSYRKVSDELGDLSHQVVGRMMQSIKEKAAKANHNPEQQINNPCLPGFSTKRLSTFTNSEGKVNQWHIQEPEKYDLEKIQDELKSVFSDIRPLKPTPTPRVCDKKLCNIYPIGDHHYGMMSWAGETGQDWDDKKSEKVLTDAVQNLLHRSPNASTGYLLNLGDFFHADGWDPRTPASGHSLDVSARFGKVARNAGLLVKSLIELMLFKHKKVFVINVRGNHDPNAGLWLNEVCRAYFHRDRRVTVLDNHSKFVQWTFGNSMFLSHHGDKMKWDDMHKYAANKFHKDWGECRYKYGFTGHVHHESAKEIGGMLFRSFGVLPPVDAWHDNSGYGSTRSMGCLTFHEEKGYESEVEYKPGDIG